MARLEIKPLSIEQFVDMVETKPGFAFTRYGDGSFYCMQGRKGANCDGVEYTQEISSALLATLRDRSLVHSIGTLARRTANAEEWLAAMQIDLEWYDCDVMNTASHFGILKPFIDCLRKRMNILCGPSHIKNLHGFMIKRFVECHPTKAFDQLDLLEKKISYYVEKDGVDTVLISAGLAATPLVSRLHFLHPQIVVIDAGSIWDMYVGVISRSGPKKMGMERIRELGWLNFGEDVAKWTT